MKKTIRLLTLVLGFVLFCGVFAACDKNPGNGGVVDSGNLIAGFELPHGAGIADKDYEYDYDSSLFYRNEARITGADPGAIYVSVEDIKESYAYYRDTFKYTNEKGELDWIDGYSLEKFEAENGTEEEWVEKYGNMYYMAVTQHTYSVSSETQKKYGANLGGYRMFTTRDFVNWEVCGEIDGFALAVNRTTDWCDQYFWAPEFIRDPNTGMYYMFYGARYKSGGGSSRTYPAIMQVGGGDTANIRGDIAISPNPLGPYRIITAENYFELYAGKTKTGEILTGDTLIKDKYVEGREYYEVYGRDGKTVIGYKNGNTCYNLMGMEKTSDMPLINAGYYYPRYCTSESKIKEFTDSAMFCGSSDYENYMTEILDLNPVIDEKGDLYCYFTMDTRHSDGRKRVYGIFVIKMIDWNTPDWDTLRYVCRVNYGYIENDGSTLYGTPMEPTEGKFNEGGVNEGTNVIYHDGLYYMTYSYFGYTDTRYSVGLAVSDNAFGPFKKQYAYMPVIGKGTEYNDYKGGTGHHCFIKSGDELFMLYHATDNAMNNYDNNNNYLGRHIAIDRIFWKREEKLGYDIMYCNGATINLQPKPESFTGYKNVARYATVTGNGNVGKTEYVNDGMFTAQPFSRKYEYGKTDGGLRIKMTWETPVTVKAIMIYNSGSYYEAFNKVNAIRFKLAEKPSWYALTEYNGYCYIKDLPVDSRDVMTSEELMRHGSAAIAEFNEITITEMEFFISGDLADKYTDQSADMTVEQGYKQVRVSDVYVFGNQA